MSNLRRSRPEEQDASLKRFQEISRHRLDSAEQASPTSPGRRQQFQEAGSSSRSNLYSLSSSPLNVQIPEDSVPLSQRALGVKACPPVSPKPRTRSETNLSTAQKLSTSASQILLPTRRYLKMLSSPCMPAIKRSGSEPLLDRLSSNDLQHKQVLHLNEADRKWEMLRHILTAMRDEPFDVESSLAGSPEVLNIQQEKINAHVELQMELAELHDVLKQKKIELQKAEAERDCALAYIRHIKMSSEETVPKLQMEEEFLRSCEGIDSLRDSSVSKENVVDMLASLVKDLHEQRSYLDRLMSVVLTRAPWMLDEVDKAELLDDRQQLDSVYDMDNYVYEDDDDDIQYDESDNEVIC